MASTPPPKPHAHTATNERAVDLNPDDIEEGDALPRERPDDVSPDDLDSDVGADDDAPGGARTPSP